MEEKVLYAVMAKRAKSFGRWDTFTIVLTDARIIVAQLTADMAKKALAEANKEGKAEGKGFFQRWGNQLKAMSNYAQRYLTMEPENILKETKGNFAIQNSDISSVSLERRWAAAGPGQRVTGASIAIEAGKQSFSGEIDEFPETLAAGFQQVFQGKITID